MLADRLVWTYIRPPQPRLAPSPRPHYPAPPMHSLSIYHQNKSPHGVRCPGFERRSDAGVDTARCGSPPSVRATESSPCSPLGSTRSRCIPVQLPCSLAALVSRSRLEGPPNPPPALQKRKNCTRLSARFTDTRCCRRTPYPVPARFPPRFSDTVPMPPPLFTRPQCMPVQLLCSFTTFASRSRGSLAASLGECSD